MKNIFSVIIIFITLPTMAYHIVGGEIEFEMVSPGEYRINLVQYFDRFQTDNPNPENQVRVYIFRNSDGAEMSNHILNLDAESLVNYTNPECSWEQLITSRVIWTGVVILNPEDYSDIEGYSIVWERCCRNAGIKNIINPGGTGMKYVTEIPPLWGKDNQLFINSSPQLFAPLGDYACINQLFYTEFTGIDRDGDSLVYSLARPLNSSSAVALPIPQPAPHPIVFFSEGYNLDNMILGNPSLSISDGGLLRVNPSESGLFLFSVVVEEFRAGLKIGQVQRDFQLLVRSEGCDPPDPPVVGIQIPDNKNFIPEIDVLNYSLSDDKCFDFIVRNISPGETISLMAEGVNFEEEVNDIFEFNVYEEVKSDSLVIEVCAPGCPPITGIPFIVDLIAGDDACPLPQMDTLRLSIKVEPPSNTFPTYEVLYVDTLIAEGVRIEFPIHSFDKDLDDLSIDYFVSGLADPSIFGFSLEETENVPGNLSAVLVWDTQCGKYDFSERQQFDVFVIVEDADTCQNSNFNFAQYDLSINLPLNTEPIISIPNYPEFEVTIEPKEILNFTLFSEDKDGDRISLRMDGVGFNPLDLGTDFQERIGENNTEADFRWKAECNYLSASGVDKFNFLFMAEDEDKCNITNTDTVIFVVNVVAPENQSPVIDRFEPIQLEVNEPFSLQIEAFDFDMTDSIRLGFSEEFRRPNSPSLQMKTQTGQGVVDATLYWRPECSLLRNNANSTYDLIFIAEDDHCPSSAYDTTRIRFEIVETRTRFENFLPPNAFSPNGDGFNEVFRLSGYDDPTKNLPTDNCEDTFEYVAIYNRVGIEVFYSEDRSFFWEGKRSPPGLYYYLLNFSKTDYKGHLLLLK